ncbi:MAG: hypothetical protein FJ125_07175 [Deltaproteobacteria bacterium]|nr:hypothetical protein [Deltaproteobacteria bacterium]
MSDAAAHALPIPLEQLPPEIHRFVDPASPTRLRLMAARSLVPLGAGQLITLLYVLCYDADPEVVGEAQSSLAKIPDEVLRPALRDALPPAVLDYLARALAQSPSHLEPLLLNRSLPHETVAWLAGTLTSQELIELIANNQDRLLRYPKIIETLYFNPRARQSTMDRVLDFAIRSGLDLSGIPAYKELAVALGYGHLYADEVLPGMHDRHAAEEQQEDAALEEELRAQLGASPAEEDGSFAELLLEASEESLEEESEQEEIFGLEGYEFSKEKKKKKKSPNEMLQLAQTIQGLEGYSFGDERGGGDDDEEGGDRASKIGNMRASQKIRLALLGSASDRSVLIRDPQKIVALSVIKSPKVTPREVEFYAGSPSVNSDVIRYIAYSRDWVKDYRVKVKLIFNPKCPIGQAVSFLKFLRRGDLKAVSVSRNLPEAIVSAARGMMRAQAQAEAKAGKK